LLLLVLLVRALDDRDSSCCGVVDLCLVDLRSAFAAEHLYSGMKAESNCDTQVDDEGTLKDEGIVVKHALYTKLSPQILSSQDLRSQLVRLGLTGMLEPPLRLAQHAQKSTWLHSEQCESIPSYMRLHLVVARIVLIRAAALCTSIQTHALSSLLVASGPVSWVLCLLLLLDELPGQVSLFPSIWLPAPSLLFSYLVGVGLFLLQSIASRVFLLYV
jgi:hypothetical protein